jgi:hypothetical protein
MVALLTLRKTPLKICLKRRSCKIFLVLGCMALILNNKLTQIKPMQTKIISKCYDTVTYPRMRITNKSLASGST